MTVFVNTVSQMTVILVLNVYKIIELQNQAAYSVKLDTMKIKLPKSVIDVVQIVNHVLIILVVQKTVLTNVITVTK